VATGVVHWRADEIFDVLAFGYHLSTIAPTFLSSESPNIMKVTYDASVDVLRILFSDMAIAESDEDKTGVIIDYAADGSIIGVEILDASKHVSNPSAVEYAVVGVKSSV
jgi:uncharacterized protein YuzE